MNHFILEPDLDGTGLHIGIVRSRLNETIGQAELDACLEELTKLGVEETHVMVASVPGALEIGVTVARMAETGEFDALIALGVVIRGETYHFEVVSKEVASAIARVALETGIPVAHGVLTVETDGQAVSRATEKGHDCARVAVEMANLISCLEPEASDENEENKDENFDNQQDNTRH